MLVELSSTSLQPNGALKLKHNHPQSLLVVVMYRGFSATTNIEKQATPKNFDLIVWETLVATSGTHNSLRIDPRVFI